MSHHFDELSKSLADESMPRRDTFRLLGAAVAGALLGPLGVKSALGGVADPCKAFCNQCPKAQRDQCPAACRSCNQIDGRLCGSCGGFTCCRDAQTCCSNYCADLSNNVNNCGACGNHCPPFPGIEGYAVCNAGACEYRFCSPLTNYNWDSNNCGRCGNVCPQQTACSNGVCEGGGG